MTSARKPASGSGHGLRSADQVIAQTTEQAELLYENYGLRCTAVIRNFHLVPPLVEKPDGPVRVIWVANLKPAKRPELFVDLARLFLDRDDVEFTMIGAIQNKMSVSAKGQYLERARWTAAFAAALSILTLGHLKWRHFDLAVLIRT